MLRFLTLAVFAAGSLLCFPALAQTFGGGLDPTIAQPLTVMSNMAGQQCQMGNQQGCMTLRQIQQGAAMLMQAQGACQQGNAQACQMYQMGAQQVMMLYGQVQAASGGRMMPSPMPQNGFNPGAMPPPLPPQNGFNTGQTQLMTPMQGSSGQTTMQNRLDLQNRQWQQNQ